MAPLGPYKLVTVNTAPARAKLLIGRVVEDVKDQWTIDYLANAERELPICYSCPSWKLDLKRGLICEIDIADIGCGNRH